MTPDVLPSAHRFRRQIQPLEQLAQEHQSQRRFAHHHHGRRQRPHRHRTVSSQRHLAEKINHCKRQRRRRQREHEYHQLSQKEYQPLSHHLDSLWRALSRVEPPGEIQNRRVRNQKRDDIPARRKDRHTARDGQPQFPRELFTKSRRQSEAQDDQQPLHGGQNHRRREQFAQRHLPAFHRIRLEHVGHRQVVPEILPHQLRADQEGHQQKHPGYRSANHHHTQDFRVHARRRPRDHRRRARGKSHNDRQPRPQQPETPRERLPRRNQIFPQQTHCRQSRR